MATFEQLQNEFLDKWAKREGASTQTVDDLKSAFDRFKGLLKYRGFTGDYSRIDSAVVDHFCEVLEGKGIAKVELEHIRTVLYQFAEFAKERSGVQKPPEAKAESEAKPAQAKPKARKVTMKLGLLIFIDLAWIAGVVYFLFVTPDLSPSLFRTLVVFLVGLAVILMIALYRMIAPRI